jgi:RNA polymerase sigma-70 factor (ECF subfamily)
VVELYRLHATGLYRYAVALARDPDSARDAVQETFLRYYQTRVQGTAIETQAAWLFRVLRNYVLDQHRGPAGRETVALAVLEDRADEGPSVEEQAARQEVAERALGLLSPRELECLRLRTQGLRYHEISEVLQIEVGTVGALLARALKKLRAALGDGRGAP